MIWMNYPPLLFAAEKLGDGGRAFSTNFVVEAALKTTP
jgi:hypothetical protein